MCCREESLFCALAVGSTFYAPMPYSSTRYIILCDPSAVLQVLMPVSCRALRTAAPSLNRQPLPMGQAHTCRCRCWHSPIHPFHILTFSPCTLQNFQLWISKVDRPVTGLQSDQTTNVKITSNKVHFFLHALPIGPRRARYLHIASPGDGSSPGHVRVPEGYLRDF